MKMNTYIKRAAVRAVTLVAAGALLTACGEDIVVGEADQSIYQASTELYGYLKNVDINRTTIGLEVRNQTALHQVYLGLSKASGTAGSASVRVAPELVNSYNDANFTSYEAFPEANVTLANDGKMEVEKWHTESLPLGITLSKTGLDNGQYLLALTLNSVSSGVKVAQGDRALYYIVTVGDPVPDNSKPFKTLCYCEVNDGNILNVGSYTLRDSGKQLFDIAVIFAANTNYNAAEQRACLTLNNNVQHVLSNRDKYIKPLQDKGIKVLLGVLGNHDFTGVANMGGIYATAFAAQCKAAVEAYGLDGIDLDDEWSKYTSTNKYGLSSGAKMAQLVLALRKAMPDKILTVYNIGAATSMPATYEGESVADAIDLGMYAYYGQYATSAPNYTTKNKYSPTATWIYSSSPTAANLLTHTQTYVVNNGFGAWFAYDIRDKDVSGYLSNASMPMFGEVVARTGPLFPKDY